MDHSGERSLIFHFGVERVRSLTILVGYGGKEGFRANPLSLKPELVVKGKGW